MSETLLCFYGLVVIQTVFEIMLLNKIDNLIVELKHKEGK